MSVFIRKGAGTHVEYSDPDRNGACDPVAMDRNALSYDEENDVWIERQPDGFVLEYSADTSSSSSSSSSIESSSSTSSELSSASSSSGAKSVEYWLCDDAGDPDPPSSSGPSSSSSSSPSSSSSIESSSSSSSCAAALDDVELELGYVRNILPVNFAVPFFGQEIDTVGAEGRADQPMLCTIDQEVFCGSSQPNAGTFERGAALTSPWYSADGIPEVRDNAFALARALTVGFRLRDEESGYNCGGIHGTTSVNVLNGNLVLSFAMAGAGPADPPIRLYYNSLAVQDDSRFGRGWSMLYDQEVVFSLDPPSSSSSGSPIYLRRLINPAGLIWKIARDEVDGRILAIKGPHGRKVTFSYQSGRLSAINDGWGRVLSASVQSNTGLLLDLGDVDFSYDANLQLRQWKNHERPPTEFEYDCALRLNRIRLPGTQVTRLGYDEGSPRKRFITDARNKVTTVTLDNEGNVNVVEEPEAITTTYTWNSRQRLTSWEDGKGNTTTLTYASMQDGSKRLSTIQRPIGTMAFAYDSSTTRLTKITDEEGNITTLQWDTLATGRNPGAVTTLINAEDNTYTYAYTTGGQLSSVTNPLSDKTTWTYDNLYRRRSTLNLIGMSLRVTTYTYNARSQVEEVTDPATAKTTITRDVWNRPKVVTSPGDVANEVVSFQYDATGRLEDLSDPAGEVWRRHYDDNGWLIEEADGRRNPVAYQHDAVGNVTTITNERGFVTKLAFDDVNRLKSITNPELEVTTFAYDKADNQTSLTNPLLRTSTYAYDGNNRLESRTDPLTHVTTFAYDDAGNLTALTDPNGNTTTTTYDALQRVSAVTDPLTHKTTYVYDDAGRLSSTQDAELNTTSYQYDELGRMTAEINAENYTTTYAYDAVGRLTKIVDQESNTVTMTYYLSGRLKTNVDARGKTTTHTYDAAERTQTIEAPALGESEPTRVTTITFDENGQISLVQANAEGLEATTPNETRYVYFEDGTLRFVRLGQDSGPTTFYSYDDAGRLTFVAGPLQTGFTYEYDAAGRRTKMGNYLNEKVTFDYDHANRLTTVTTAEGITTKYAYNAADELTTLTDGRNHSTGFAYDDAGRLESETNALSETTTYTYYDNNLLETVVDKALLATRTRTFTYDKVGNLTSATTPLSHTTTYTYYKNNLTKTRVDPRGKTTTYTYDANGMIETETPETGVTTTYAYDNLGRLHTVTDPEGETVTYEYDPHWDAISTLTDARGHATVNEYDDRGNLTKTHVPIQRPVGFPPLPVTMTTEYEYDTAGRLTKIIGMSPASTTENDSTTVVVEERAYDAASRLTTVTTPGTPPKTTKYKYDKDGRQTQIITPLPLTTTFVYDDANNLIRMTPPLGLAYATEFTLDELDRETKVTDGAGRYTEISYDNAGRVEWKKTGAAGETVTYTYDQDDRLIYIDDPESNRTTFTYDDAGNQEEIEYDSGERIERDFNDRNLVTSEDRYSGFVKIAGTAFTYDKNDRLKSRVVTDESANTTMTFTTSYDENGNVTKQESPDFDVDYKYDAGNRLYHEDRDPNIDVTITYNKAGRIIKRSMKIGSGSAKISTMTYDTSGRLKTSEVDGEKTTLTYDADGRLTRSEQPKTAQNTGVYFDYDYDDNGRVTTVTEWSYAGGGHLRQFTYTYDDANNLTGRTGSQLSYSYDDAGRVITESRTDARESWFDLEVDDWDGLSVNDWDALLVCDPTYSATFTYDKMGNVEVEEVDSESTTYTHASNRVTKRDDGGAVLTYTYDSLGRRATRVSAAGTTTYTWNEADQLVNVDGPEGTVTMAYDGNDLIQSREAQGGDAPSSEKIRYVWIGNMLAAETDDTGEILRQYDRGEDGHGTLSSVQDSSGVYVPVVQPGGTVSGNYVDTTEVQTVVTRAYGEVVGLNAVPTSPDPEGTMAKNAAFGVIRDGLTGLYYMRHRWFDPEAKQFLSSDPLGVEFGGLNAYTLADGDPINAMDPEGLDRLSIKRHTNSAGVSTRVVSWEIYRRNCIFCTKVGEIPLGNVAGGQVTLRSELGGGTLPLSLIRAAVMSAVGNGYNLAFGSSEIQERTIASILTRLRRGNKINADSAHPTNLLEAFGEGAELGALNIADTLTFSLIDSLHEANTEAWEHSGMAGTWYQTASSISAVVAREALIMAVTMGAGQALTAARGASGAGKVPRLFTKVGDKITATRFGQVSNKLVTGGLEATKRAATGSGAGAATLRGGLQAVNWTGRGYETWATVQGTRDGIKMIRDGNHLGWLNIALAGLHGASVATAGVGRVRRLARQHRVAKQRQQRLEKAACKKGGCFSAGTHVATPAGSAAIESIRVGQRVVTYLEDDQTADVRPFASDVTPETWRQVGLVLHEGEKDELEVTLLRPLSWLEIHDIEVDGTVELNLPELGARGRATVLSIEACPEIEDGDESTTRVVTATFRHRFGYPWELRLKGIDEPIGVTRNHSVWSVDRERWVAAGHLRQGERVRLDEGETRIESLTERSVAAPVFNLEVDADHVYRVTECGLLVHNAGAACEFLYRADDDPFSAVGRLGPKSSIHPSGILLPASLAGRYLGRDVRVIEHILGGYRRGAKAYSPLTSFSPDPDLIRRFGKYLVKIDAEGLAEAIRYQDELLIGTRILSQRRIQAIIAQSTTFGLGWRRRASSMSANAMEYLIRGPVPGDFILDISR